MEINEYEPTEGWKRFQEERCSGKMSIGEMAAVLMLMVIIIGSYIAVGNLEVM